MPTAPRRNSNQPQHEVRPFRERLLDFASEHERLEARYDSLKLSHETLKEELISVSVKLKCSEAITEEHFNSETALREHATQKQSLEMQEQTQSLMDEMSRLQQRAADREEQLAKAHVDVARLQQRAADREEQLAKAQVGVAQETRRALEAAAEARRLAEAKVEADLLAEALHERARLAEAKAQRVEAGLRAQGEELHRLRAAEERLALAQAERERTRTDEAAAAPAPSGAVHVRTGGEARAAGGAAEATAAGTGAPQETARAAVAAGGGSELQAKAPAADAGLADAEAEAEAMAEAKATARAAERQKAAEASARAGAYEKASVAARQLAVAGASKGLQANDANGGVDSEAGGSEKGRAPVARKLAKWTELEHAESGERRGAIAHALPILGKLMDSDWHGSYVHSPTARARLFVFYGAGDKGLNYGPWQHLVKKQFPEIEMLVFEYPGHGKHKADVIGDVNALEQEFTQQVIQYKDGFQNYFSCPYGVVGQSAGARFGVNMVRKLANLGAKPEKFYVVGRSPPTAVASDPRVPAGTDALLDWVCEHVMTSTSKDIYKARLSAMTQLERQAEEQTWRADMAMNGSAVPPLPRRWRVGRAGTICKRGDENPVKRIRIARPPGFEVFVTGEEERGAAGERWLRIDDARTGVKPGWYLVHGGPLGINEDLLEPADSGSEPADEHSHYFKVPVRFQVHYSTGDRIAPREDASRRMPPMRDWNRLTALEPEFMEYEGLEHHELLMHPQVLENICQDFLRVCRLR